MNKTIKLILILLGLPIGLFVVWILYLWIEIQVNRWWRSTEPNAPVIGNLGGVPVAIPREYARFVEYDADPHFMEKKWRSRPKRTFESGLRSFGFEVRYPDMASARFKTKADENIRTTMWMRVGITSGEFYGDGKGLERRKSSLFNRKSAYFVYEPLPGKTHGLIGYTPVGPGINVAARDLASGLGASIIDSNVYYHEDEYGQVTTFIKCGNMTHSADRCEQSFYLSGRMKGHISVNYRKELLPYWQEIQKSVADIFYGFEVSSD